MWASMPPSASGIKGQTELIAKGGRDAPPRQLGRYHGYLARQVNIPNHASCSASMIHTSLCPNIGHLLPQLMPTCTKPTFSKAGPLPIPHTPALPPHDCWPRNASPLCTRAGLNAKDRNCNLFHFHAASPNHSPPHTGLPIPVPKSLAVLPVPYPTDPALPHPDVHTSTHTWFARFSMVWL